LSCNYLPEIDSAVLQTTRETSGTNKKGLLH
jgi:hypothetical protein